MDTVPTGNGSGPATSVQRCNRFRPSTSHANPNYNPALPVSTSNPQTLRSEFPNNVIPAARLNSAAALMLQNYGAPNSMGDMGYGMTMNGTPRCSAPGMDSNNLLDVRDGLERNNQGTVRVDHTFGDKDTLSGRFSSSNEQGFMPQNLPVMASTSTTPRRTVHHLDAHHLADSRGHGLRRRLRLAMHH